MPRRYDLIFNPGDLSSRKIAALDGRPPIPIKQRRIHKSKLDEIRSSPIEVVAASSDADPIVFFVTDTGVRRLADGNHRLTVADRASISTVWPAVDRYEADFALYGGDWFHQHKMMCARKPQTFEDRIGAMRGASRWFVAFTAQDPNMRPTETRSRGRLSFRNAVNAYLMAQTLAAQRGTGHALTVRVPNTAARQQLLDVTDVPPDAELHELARRLSLWVRGVVDAAADRKTAMPLSFALNAKTLAVWLALYEENIPRVPPAVLDGVPARIAANAANVTYDKPTRATDIARYLLSAANYKRIKHRFVFDGVEYRV